MRKNWLDKLMKKLFYQLYETDDSGGGLLVLARGHEGRHTWEGQSSFSR